MRNRMIVTVAGLATLLAGCGPSQPTVEEARQFLNAAEERLLLLSNESGRAAWIQTNFITDDTEALAAQTNERSIAAQVELAKEATRFDGLALPDDLARKLRALKLSLTLAAPSDPKEREETTRIGASLESAYGKGRYCPPNRPDTSDCLDLQQIMRIMATNRDPQRLLEVWSGWRTISPPLRKDYARFVELSNKGARELGFADTGAMWRSKYDMPPDEFAAELDRLWEQVKPLYVSLHAYVRKRLRAKYGDTVPADGPIPAHLLGNVWAQSWDNIADIAAAPGGAPAYDLTRILRDRRIDARGMVRYGEQFFTSLNFPPLPTTFWDRSLFTKPADRDVVCHASAWNVDNNEDLRIKMCIEITEEDFSVIHHELGHNFYQRAYNKQPFLFRESANDGFHEAVGDTIALSITPEYLVKLGFLRQAPDPSRDTDLLLRRALEKVAFLPFGLLIDQWRWKVFSGEVPPEQYNTAWWELRRKYQGIDAPADRTEQHFDPGAKYHVPANVPYTRYFLAHILQFQFHRALARAAGCTGPLHRCSIYGNREAGAKLKEMLEMGSSRPWPEALRALTGEDKMDATAILDYFAPLKEWLDAQNSGGPAGW
ncbi:MAG: M2 family metallopeptidase [Bryobacterales bacterium]|nr:M2 family metallopeptidase [Bryobacterales bacterium]